VAAMRVLVTGASGHVGGAVAAHLVRKGWDVIGLSRRRSAIEGLTQQIEADLSAPSFVEQVRAILPACDAIVHAAATLDKEIAATSISLTNGVGMQQILTLAQGWRVQSFVYTSSVPVIGVPQSLPVTEEHPVNPPTAYHASKVYGEYLLALACRTGIAGAALRLTSPIGPGMPDKRIFSVFVKRAQAGQPLQLAGQGSRRQNYVDVRDVAAAVEQCLRERAEGLFNIAGEQSISNLDLARACVRTLDSSSPITFSGQPDPEEGITWDISIARAMDCFGYTPRYDIAASIRAVSNDASRAD
jgi:nucleoside-diphosphate-sugar epimerase